VKRLWYRPRTKIFVSKSAKHETPYAQSDEKQ